MNCICRKSIIGVISDVSGADLHELQNQDCCTELLSACPKFISFFFFFLRPYSILWVSFSFLSPHWSESETVTVMVFMSYTWHISPFIKAAGEKVNLIFSLLYTHPFLYSLIFNICLFKNVFFSGLSLSIPFSLDFPLWLLSSWPLHSWILDLFETGNGPLPFLGRHLPALQRRERQVRCL